MTFPDHGGQETPHIQQVGQYDSCICRGPIEVMGKGMFFLHHRDDCPNVAAWLKRSGELSAMRHRFKEYGYPS